MDGKRRALRVKRTLEQRGQSRRQRPQSACDGAHDVEQGEEIRAPSRRCAGGQDGLFQRAQPACPDESAEVTQEGGHGQDDEALTHDQHDPGERREEAQNHERASAANGAAQHPRHHSCDRRSHGADAEKRAHFRQRKALESEIDRDEHRDRTLGKAPRRPRRDHNPGVPTDPRELADVRPHRGSPPSLCPGAP
jgi:hypothetical protein